MRLAIVAILGLTACTDAQLSSFEAKRAAWICTHQAATVASSNAQIAGAAKIKDPAVRDAVIARAQADLGVVANCKS